MPKIYGEGRPPGCERWVIGYDCMTEEDLEEMKKWEAELLKPWPVANDNDYTECNRRTSEET